MPSAVGAAPGTALGTAAASALPADDVVARLGTGPGGLTADEVARRHETVGPNVIAVRRVRFVAVLARQLRSALLLLLVVTATVSFFLGNRTDAAIIGVILVVSVGLGCFNEYRAELAAQALHTQIRHEVVVRRDGHARNVDVTELVPGDVVRLTVGQIVPADVRILRRGEPRVRRVGAHGRVRARREVRRAGRTGRGARRPLVVRLHGHRRAQRRR